MKWTTRAHLHLDRTASAWLIRRFIDSYAEFQFLNWDEAPDSTDPRFFGMPGVALSSHDDEGTSFDKILRAHDLSNDQALIVLADCVRAGVRNALSLPRTEDNETRYALGIGLDALGTGMGIDHVSDDAHLAAATPAYDAFYTYCMLPDLSTAELPKTQPERAEYLRSLVA